MERLLMFFVLIGTMNGVLAGQPPGYVLARNISLDRQKVWPRVYAEAPAKFDLGPM
jgi:hypothetical protein